MAALAFIVLLAMFTRAVVAGSSRPQASLDDETNDEGGRRIVLHRDDDTDDDFTHRIRDPGGQGSVREAWERASSERRRSLDEPLPAIAEALIDPQLHRFRDMWSDGTTPPFEPAEQRGHLISARGLGLDPNASCDVRVLPVRGQFTCLVRVMCGDTVVYPNPSQTAGYLNCTMDEFGRVAGADNAPTTADGDPQIQLDAETGRVRISNLDWNGPGTAFDVEVAIDFANSRSGV
jgi:hypothetical protein